MSAARYLVAVETDGAGAYRARCMCAGCDWCSAWFEPGKYWPENKRNALAVTAAQEHGATHAADATVADAYRVTARRCNVCGTDTRHDAGRCTNGRCGPCHRACCTPGGETSPGHGLGSPEVIAARRAELTANGFRDYDATHTTTTEPKP